MPKLLPKLTFVFLKKKLLFFLTVFGVLIVLALGWLKFGTGKIGEVRNLRPGEIQIINSPEAAYQIKINTSTSAKKEVIDFFKNTLKEMGYSLSIYNREKLTDEFTFPGDVAPGSHHSGCNTYGWRWDNNSRSIDVFFFVDKPTARCDALTFTDVVGRAITAAKGGGNWRDCLGPITQSIGRQLTNDDMPIGVSK